MPRQDYEPEMFAPDERQIVDDAEIPSDAIELADGTILVPVDDDEDAEFFVGPDSYIYPVGSGISLDEYDEADEDQGYYTQQDFDYDDGGISYPEDQE